MGNANNEKGRSTKYERKSKETQIEIPRLNIDGVGINTIYTSIGFLDHMLSVCMYHGFFDLSLKASGDTHVDNHHLNEDIGIALGEAFKQALGDCKGITRMASAEIDEYRVRNGDSLWNIAKAHGTTVDRLKQENNLRGSRIYAGQLLKVPSSR